MTSITAPCYTCAIVSGGGVQCWGAVLGGSAATHYVHPRPVSGLSGVAGIAAGQGHVCALAGGAVQCWGDDSAGQLGEGTTTNQTAPNPIVPALVDVTAITAGGASTCALLLSGLVDCWGSKHLPERSATAPARTGTRRRPWCGHDRHAALAPTSSPRVDGRRGCRRAGGGGVRGLGSQQNGRGWL